MFRSAAYATISRKSSCVKYIPRPYSVSSKNLLPSPGLVNEPERIAPTDVSLGYSGISMRQPWSSVRCQCRRFSLYSAMMSNTFFTSSLSKKWRATSIIKPRCPNCGWSVMETNGSSHFALRLSSSPKKSRGSNCVSVCIA